MGSGIFYPRLANTKEYVKKNRFMRKIFLSGVLLFGMHLNASANNRPSFDGGTSQNRMVCQDVSWNISSWLNVTDVDFFDTQTWFVESGSISGGSLSGFPATATNHDQ